VGVLVGSSAVPATALHAVTRAVLLGVDDLVHEADLLGDDLVLLLQELLAGRLVLLQDVGDGLGVLVDAAEDAVEGEGVGVVGVVEEGGEVGEVAEEAHELLQTPEHAFLVAFHAEQELLQLGLRLHVVHLTIIIIR